jgi:hypothetical protein
MSQARRTASDARSDGLELVSNLREMGDALRSNAERLLGDVQSIHRRMVAELDREERALGLTSSSGPRRPSPGAPPREESRDDGGDNLDVPEFIPPG